MSVTSQVPYKKYTAAPGAVLFATTFRVLRATDLEVRVNDVVVTSGFTLSALGGASVDVTFSVPKVGGEKVELQRKTPLTRSTDYQQSGDFQTPVVNADFDRLWMAGQEMTEQIERSIRVPIGSGIDPDQLIADLTQASIDAVAAAGDATSAAAVASAAADAAASSAASIALPLPVASGGTGGTNAAGARANLGAAASGAVTGSGLTMATAKLVGRTTATTGAPEEIAIGAGLSMASGVLAAVKGYMLMQIKLATGTSGGTASVGDNARLMTTLVRNTIPGASMVAGRARLPAGTYRKRGVSTVYSVNQSRAYFKNITAGTKEEEGAQAIRYNTNAGGGEAGVENETDYLVTTDVELGVYCETGRGTNGFGEPFTGGAAGTPEMYGYMVIEQVA